MCSYWPAIIICVWIVRAGICGMKIWGPREMRGRSRTHFRLSFASFATSPRFLIRQVRQNCWLWIIQKELRMMVTILKTNRIMSMEEQVNTCIHKKRCSLFNSKTILISIQGSFRKAKGIAGAGLHRLMVASIWHRPPTLVDHGSATATLKSKAKHPTQAALISPFRGHLHSTWCAVVLRNSPLVPQAPQLPKW